MEKITSAKAIFAPLFHARHHPHYQEIEMVEAVQRQSVPQDLKPFFDQTESVCLYEDEMSGEGLDFKAEVVNKDVQSDWLRVTRNLKNLKEIRAKANEVMGTTSSNHTRQSKDTDRDLSEQVSAWRVHLRASNYLDQPLNGSMNHISLTAEELDSSLLDNTNLAENSRKRFFDKVILGLNVDDNVQDPEYVTKKEREEKNLILNKTKSEIADTISSLLGNIPIPDLKNSLQTDFTKNLISNKTKSEIADTISSLLGNIPIPDLKNSLQTDFTKMMPVAKVKKCAEIS